MAYLAPVPKLQFFDSNGNPLSNGLLYTYSAGTTTPLATYTDSSGGTPNANPVVLNSRGEASVWFGTSLYKLVLKTSSGVEIWTVDNVGSDLNFSTLASSTGASLIGYSSSGTGAVSTNVQSKLREILSVKDFGAVGDGVADDTAAIQLAVNACINKGLYFPAGTYKITSSINVSSPTFAANDTIMIYGDGPYNSVISATGDITAFFIQDQAGIKGGMSDLGIINAGNEYKGGGAVSFIYPASIGLHLKDTFQFQIKNVTIEQFGTGLLVQNYSYWSEGTYAENLWCRNNNVGMLFERATNTATDSFSHTQIIGSKIQIAKDFATNVWGTGLQVKGFSGATAPVQIYNGIVQINMWTGDSSGAGATIGSYISLVNRGRIDCSFLNLTFERYGKILINDGSYIQNSHTFFASIDSTQVIFEDNNTSKNSKFRSRYYGNINENLVNMSVANWRGTGVTATMRQGWQQNSATGYQFGTGTGLSFPFVTSLNTSGNGFFYGTTPDYEDNITWRFAVDNTGRVYPRFTTAYLDATTGASTTGLTAGTIKMRTDTARAVDLCPVWVGIGPDDTGAPLQVIRAAVTASRPSSPGAIGQMFYDTTLGKPIWWNGSVWKDATGATV